MPTVDAAHAKALAEISVEHYLTGRSKVDIAKARGISRFQVARMLDQARELGIVRIEVATPAHLDAERSDALARDLGVREVVVAPAGDGPAAARHNVARELARIGAERVRPGMTLGVSWSRTIELAVRAISTLPPCEVVQLGGALPVAGRGNSLEMIHRFAAIDGVRTWPIWAPLVVRDAATATGLRHQPEIAAALRRADDLDVAVVAVGGWAPGSSTVYDHVDEAERRRVAEAGAAGECSGRVFDAEGRPVATSLDERVVGVRLEQLVRAPERIVVGLGEHTAPALRAAARGGFATVLVMDEAAAAALEAR